MGCCAAQGAQLCRKHWLEGTLLPAPLNRRPARRPPGITDRAGAGDKLYSELHNELYQFGFASRRWYPLALRAPRAPAPQARGPCLLLLGHAAPAGCLSNSLTRTGQASSCRCACEHGHNNEQHRFQFET